MQTVRNTGTPGIAHNFVPKNALRTTAYSTNVLLLPADIVLMPSLVDLADIKHRC